MPSAPEESSTDLEGAFKRASVFGHHLGSVFPAVEAAQGSGVIQRMPPSESDDEGSESADEERDDDEDYAPQKKVKIDLQSKPNPETYKITNSPSGSKHVNYSTFSGTLVHAIESSDRMEILTKAEIQGTLPPNTRTPTEQLPGKVILKSEEKGKQGGRKYNPNDTVTSHAVPSKVGVPATQESLNADDTSQKYNRETARVFEDKYLNNPKTRKPHSAEVTRKKEKCNASDRLQEIADLPDIKASLSRIGKRAEAFRGRAKKDGSETPLTIKARKATATSPGGTVIGTGSQGRDLYWGTKDKWFKDGYDPNNSSGDDDVVEGKTAKKVKRKEFEKIQNKASESEEGEGNADDSDG